MHAPRYIFPLRACLTVVRMLSKHPGGGCHLLGPSCPRHCCVEGFPVPSSIHRRAGGARASSAACRSVSHVQLCCVTVVFPGLRVDWACGVGTRSCVLTLSWRLFLCRTGLCCVGCEVCVVSPWLGFTRCVVVSLGGAGVVVPTSAAGTGRWLVPGCVGQGARWDHWGRWRRMQRSSCVAWPPAPRPSSALPCSPSVGTAPTPPPPLFPPFCVFRINSSRRWCVF